MDRSKTIRNPNEGMNLTLEEIREKGKTLGFSYTQSISLFLFEKILIWISQSDLKEDMWLKQAEIYPKENKKKVIPNQIVCYMKEISYQVLEQAMESMLNVKNQEDTRIDWEILFFDRQLEIVLKCPTEHITIPFKIIVRPVWQQEQFPEEETYQLLFQENVEITYKAYPVELHLAECFYEILSRLELIGDMKPYDTVYRILKSQPVNGRRMCLNMTELLEKQEIVSLEKRWDTILGYANYTYMKKRWNKYQKAGKERVAWEDAMKIINEFFTPVWEAIQKDMIFLEDWMPYLGRYLG